MSRVLVANRGEIARRIIKACHGLGYQAVAVHSEVDAQLAHVKEADHSIEIGPAPAKESYLNIQAILDAAIKMDCEFLHPGYGFLSENAEFAEEVIKAGIRWIGPRPETIKTMGDKNRARSIVAAVGVPIVPGSKRLEPGMATRTLAAAKDIGLPLLVKAAAGGGGIGMRRVDSIHDLEKIVEATQVMAENVFGDRAVFLEKFIPKSRHVEVQIFGFEDGSCIHIFERECSLQRRFQKVIEESPAPDIPPEALAQMFEAAVAICRETKYVGAGTVEFILDPSTNEFFFLELNTRIQVEHPVTEMITGLDLVGMQIQCAAGTSHAITQSSVSRSGVAIECRLYAESPDKMFMPSPGVLERFVLPDENASVRIDSGYQQGDTLTHFYDPMIAKLIFFGKTREEARHTAIDALSKIEVDGVKTNRDFLISCLRHRDYVEGKIHTTFVQENIECLIKGNDIQSANS